MLENTTMIVNILVRILPACLYGATLISGMLMDNLQAFILLFGHLINDILSIGYRSILKSQSPPQCAFIKIGNVYYNLPSSHIQIISYYTMFFLLDMYNKDEYDMSKVLFLLALLGVTIWSRVNIGCESLMDVTFGLGIGSTIAILYYMFIRDYYMTTPASTTESTNNALNSVFSYFN
jgi:hypothetical protein